MTDEDKDALDLALSRILGNPDHEQHSQIAAKLTEQAWIDVARFAAYSEQIDSLNLKPWQAPPSQIDDPDAIVANGATHPDYKAAKLLKRMLAWGVSKFAPDPVHAIERAKLDNVER
ncbi:hypothetical protein ACQR06_23475 [Bradyrhizobium sp. HKCCYLRH1065]|uniref:hypothetical protein n=1 Tax=Bradyrhizobium sp. HKCCYLRH1065 TaxID=3420753 RepID=UPI003EBEB6D0